MTAAASPRPPDLPEDIELALLDILDDGGDATRLDDLKAEHADHADAIDALLATLGLDAEQPQTIGDYAIVERIGEGGMGTVYLARQSAPIDRFVAIKLIRHDRLDTRLLARFHAERIALARMEHSSICRIFDGGADANGRAFFVMEYVRGVPVDAYCDAERLDLRARVELLIAVCHGVQHAHSKGIIHRDLKPSNVLVSLEDGAPLPKIIDFGLARAATDVARGGGPRPLAPTLHGSVLGTPAYASPEQLGPTNLDVDTRADVYALGVLLYELLVGRTPFQRPGEPVSTLEMQRRVREDEPRRPSLRFAQDADAAGIAHARRASARQLERALRGDLDWIALRALEKDRTRRYQTAAELAADLQRYLEHEPVHAGPPNFGYRLRKLAKRYRTQVVAAAVTTAAVLLGAVGTLFGLSAAEEQAARARSTLEQLNVTLALRTIEAAEAAEPDVFPAWPENRDALARWLDDFGAPIVELAPKLREAVAATTLFDPATSPFDGAFRTSVTALRERADAFLAADGPYERVRRGLVWADTVETRTVAAHRGAWDRAIRAIAEHPDYRGLELRPQLGLVPLGPDPDSGLHEFYHCASAADPDAVPSRDAAGRLPPVRAEDGVVLVLVPGGDEITIGAQRDHTDRPRYDPAADYDEPLRTVELAAYLIGKHELTLGQWRRLTTEPHLNFYVGTPDHPVENVTWLLGDATLRRWGLDLPTEAQWEHAARGGTDTPWSSGRDVAALEHAANLADEDLAANEPMCELYERWSDGHLAHAPVGSFRPNGFGLHDVHGNVMEWCRDWYHPRAALRAEDGLADVPPVERGERACRGGSCMNLAVECRSAYRNYTAPDDRGGGMGLRAVRRLRP